MDDFLSDAAADVLRELFRRHSDGDFFDPHRVVFDLAGLLIELKSAAAGFVRYRHKHKFRWVP